MKVSVEILVIIVLLLLILLSILYYMKKFLNIFKTIVLDIKEIKSYIRHMDTEFTNDSNLAYSAYKKFIHIDDKIDNTLDITDSLEGQVEKDGLWSILKF